MTSKQQRGQFFTVNEKVLQDILSLLGENPGNTLEPSAGAGHIMQSFTEKFAEQNNTQKANTIIGWELDNTVQPCSDNLRITYGDFFTQASIILPNGEATLLDMLSEGTKKQGEKFDSIVGNPPFVGWRNVEEATRNSAATVKARYSDKTNLYHLFMDRCIDILKDDGQMVFIVPKEWMYSTSALPLREKMLALGTITHIIDGGEEKVFPDADVAALVIFRFQKTPTNSHKVQFRSGFVKNVSEWTEKFINITEAGLWWVTEKEQKNVPVVGDYFDVKVGILTGADGVFNVTQHESLEKFKKENSAAAYMTTRGVEWFIDVHDVEKETDLPEEAYKYLLPFKEKLASRKITKFSEKNWWKYGAIRNKNVMLSSRDRIYTFMKTRSEAPFFVNNETKLFSGNIIALFLKDEVQDSISIDEALEYFNSSKFRKICEEFGITTSNKVSFQPATLSELPFTPDTAYEH